MLSSDITKSISKQIEYTKAMSNGNKNITASWTSKYEPLSEVEAYIKRKVKKLPIELSYDVTAIENLYFKTLNYTTYAGFLILHPLCVEQAKRQMSDAYADCYPSAGHIDYIKSKMGEGDFAKYQFAFNEEHEYDYNTLVILPGGNKIKKHSCIGKLKRILDKHGPENVIMKKHPVSYDEVYTELNDALGGVVRFAKGNESLQKLMQKADTIYSTMISETALTGNILGKKVGHYDLFQNRDTASFFHINYYIFTVDDPVAWADRAFASPKSGVVHPDVDKDWKTKIDQYLDYIMSLRSFYKDAYVWR